MPLAAFLRRLEGSAQARAPRAPRIVSPSRARECRVVTLVLRRPRWLARRDVLLFGPSPEPAVPSALPRTLLVLALASAPAHGARPQEAFDHSHARWSAVLAGCVREDGVDYARLKAERAGLDAYLASLHAVTPAELAGWSQTQRFAFWINAYNAHCLQRVIDAYPLKSLRRLDGVGGMNTVFDKGFIPMRAHHP